MKCNNHLKKKNLTILQSKAPFSYIKTKHQTNNDDMRLFCHLDLHLLSYHECLQLDVALTLSLTL